MQREFIYFSKDARTSGNFDDLMKAGRLDIACHTIIAALFLSHDIRKDVRLHLIFNGPPDPPKHLLFKYDENMPISKKDVSGLLKRMLYKHKKGLLFEVFPGCFIEKKSFRDVVNEFIEKGKQIYLLESRGKDIRELSREELENSVFIIGDEEGIPKQELRMLRKSEIPKVSIGHLTYFASHTIRIFKYPCNFMRE